MSLLHRILIAFSITFCSLSALRSQTAEDVVKQYVQAVGGAEAWKKAQSLTMEGKVLLQGMEMPSVTHMKRPGFFYQEISFMGKKIIQATDGKKGWYINPFMGSDKPQEMKPEEVEELKEGSQFDDQLMFFKEKGGQVSLIGEEKIEGIPCMIVDLTIPGKQKKRYFLDKELWLPVKEVSEGPNGEEVEQWLSDYRLVDGKWLPFKMIQKVKGEVVSEIILDKVVFDSVQDDSIFSMPKP